MFLSSPSLRRGQRTIFLACGALVLASLTAVGAEPSHALPPAPGASSSAPPVLGLLVNVKDVAQALPFYTEVAGFEVVSRREPCSATLRNGAVILTLAQVPRAAQIDYPKEVETHINFQVRDMDAAFAALKRSHFTAVGTLEQAAIGSFLAIKDPSGNIHHLMQLKEPSASLTKPAVFNVGIKVTDMKKARDFYCNKLGFEIFSEDYYPPTIPLKKSGVVALTLHDNATTPVAVRYPDTAQTIVLLGTPDLDASMRQLSAKGIEFLEGPQTSESGRHAAFRDPFGNVLELVETGQPRRRNE